MEKQATDIQQTAQQLATAVSEQQMLLSEKVGAIKATGFFKKVSTVTEIKLIAEIKENKQYKGLSMVDFEGKVVTCNTFQDFCKAIGHSYEKVNQDIQNLSAFGEDFLETSQRMGVGYRDLRKLRKLSEDEQAVVINGEAVKAQDKESLIDLIEEMSAKSAKDKAELQQKVNDLQADNNAKDKVLATKDKKINELDQKLTLKTDPSQKHMQAQAMQDHITDELAQAGNSMLTQVAQFNAKVIALKEKATDQAPHLLEKIEQDISFVYGHIAQLSVAEGIGIDLENLITPEWMKAES